MSTIRHLLEILKPIDEAEKKTNGNSIINKTEIHPVEKENLERKIVVKREIGIKLRKKDTRIKAATMRRTSQPSNLGMMTTTKAVTGSMKQRINWRK